MKTYIFYTGSFNPVTKAHFEILSDAVSTFHADRGFFVATNDDYLHKKELIDAKVPTSFILSEETRKTMLNTLVDANPKLSFWGFEIGGASPSTYKTLKKFHKDMLKANPGEEIKILMAIGADKLRHLSHWTDIDEIFNLCDVLVYSRSFDIDAIIAADEFLTAHKAQIHSLSTSDSMEDVSSTEVRRRFFAAEDYRSLMCEGPFEMLSAMSPADFPPLTDEDIIKAHILYGGRFGKNTARLHVYKANLELFKRWNLPALGNKDEHRSAKVYRSEFEVAAPVLAEPTTFGCFNADCANVAQSLLREGLKPAILNLASNVSPGGGYHKGLLAQEESLCYASTLSQSLYQFGNPKYKHIREAGLNKYTAGVYPMDIRFGGIYSPQVSFFRNNADAYYSLREEPFDCPVITVASLSNREPNEYAEDESRYFRADGFLTDEGKGIEADKIRTIFRIALDNGRDSLVLGAFGCGVYNLLPEEVSRLFYDVLQEDEFKNRFKKVVFAIYEGAPTRRNPNKGAQGKFKAFYDLFS